MVMWFTKGIRETLSELDTNLQSGLSSEEANKRLEKFGPNEFIDHQKPSFITLFMRQINSPLIYILLLAAIISIAVSEYSDAIIIAVVIILNAVIGLMQEMKAEKALEELKKMTTPKAVVKRDGILQEIPSERLVPGDIVMIDAGRYIPADLRLTETVNLKMEESSLTGESVPVEKDANWKTETTISMADQQNMAFMSTLSTYGRGQGVVVHTGMNTEIGKIANMLGEQTHEQTPLQLKLAELGKILGFGAVIISAIIFTIGFFQDRNPMEMFLIAVSLAVAAIPEGLPAIVTIVLALGVQRMIKRRAVVRKLPAVETLGAVSVICSDKTGTLTQNKMTVTHVFLNGKSQLISSVEHTSNLEKLFFEAMALCNDAEVLEEKQTGDPTEIALIIAAGKAGINKQELDLEYNRIFEIPFDSDRKMMTTVHKKNDKTFAMVKGALESILPLATHIVIDEKAVPISQDLINMIKAEANKMSSEALRVLGIAYKEVEPQENFTQQSLEKDLILLGMTGMIDPPREEVKEAISLCKQAGIKTVMITGDHQKTAFAIAKQLGIASHDGETISGAELDSMEEHEFIEKVKHLRVFARVSPEHKVKIVKALKANGEIASMTGDGVNDAPSLKQADVGVAMGMSGTDVAKGAADIILTDDNFATIVAAVEEGRNIYQNIKKSILFLLSCNLGEIITLFLAILLGWPTPLTAIHILWINLITDTLPAISLGVDPDDPDILKEQPRSIKESIFAHGGAAFTIMNGILIGVITLFAFTAGLTIYTRAESIFSIDFAHVSKDALTHAQTMAFITLSVSQLFHSFNVRNQHKSLIEIGLLTNKFLIASISIGIILQASLVHIPLFNRIFEIHSLVMKDWLLVLALSLLPVLVNELWKAGKRIIHLPYQGKSNTTKNA
ncbi:cation-translocating P-type ATPase [Neobacillus sp. LXY-1]|uniref:cation-translocating P-type ATPase n=1 Tax=Neobacillus sp. LXY-1 TaxID=3379133 RepID=UPI003EE0B63D